MGTQKAGFLREEPGCGESRTSGSEVAAGEGLPRRLQPSYPSNLSDAEWECLQQYLPPQSKRGRPPIHSLRSIFDAIFYVALHRLPMALSPRQLSTVANRLLPFPAFATRMEPRRSQQERC